MVGNKNLLAIYHQGLNYTINFSSCCCCYCFFVAIIVVVVVAIILFNSFKSLEGSALDCGKLVFSYSEVQQCRSGPGVEHLCCSFFSSSEAPRSHCFKNRSCGNMAQSQVLKARYLRLRPESELSSAEPFHSSHLSLSWAASNGPLCTTGASRRTLDPQSHIL